MIDKDPSCCRRSSGGGQSMKPFIRIAWVALMALFSLDACSPGSNLPELAVKPDVSAYHLGPGARLEIRVLGADELTGQYSLQDDGTITILMSAPVPTPPLPPNQSHTHLTPKSH